MDKFLVLTMQKFNSEMDDDALRQLASEFTDCLFKVREIFGIYAFRKFYERGGRRGPLNKALFETWTVSVRGFGLQVLIERRDVIVAKFLELMNNDVEFNKSITQGTGSFRAVKTRYERIEKLLSEACG